MNGSETVTIGSYATATFTADGMYNISYFAIDSAGNAEAPKAMTVKIDKTPPAINLTTNLNILWPPNHEMVDVTVSGDASDNISDVAAVIFTVTDEYGRVQPTLGGFNASIPLEAWRDGTDKDGRSYTITAVATDAAGNKTTASTVILVPHDQR